MNVTPLETSEMTDEIPGETNSTQRPLAFSYVRFSSEKQRQGASLERQTEAAKRWAEANGYTLDTNLNMQDLGVSAYKGDNATTGALSGFLRAVEAEQVPTGSILLVENLDRISRQKIRKARNTLEAIIDAGVDVVTLSNGKRYTQSDLDDDAMTGIEIILTFQRAHEESLTKSKRVKHGWQRNTEKVKEGSRKRSGATPAWIKLVGTMDDGHFEVIEEQAAITRELFERFGKGETVWSIAKRFRDRGITTPRGKTFAAGNIYRLVKSKAPYGILELGRGTKNDRTVFDQVEDYFPRIVDEETQRKVTVRLQGIEKNKEANRIVNDPSRKTHGILTGVIWSPEKAGGNRAVCRKSTDGSFAYVDAKTRRWVATRAVIEDAFLSGWAEIRQAWDVDTTPEIDAAEAALEAAREALEYAQRTRSPRLEMAAQADAEEAERYLKGLRRGQALMGDELPTNIDPETCGMERWEINEVVRRVVDRIEVIRSDQRKGRKAGEDGRKGKLTMLKVTLRNKQKVYAGDTQLLMSS